MIFLTENSAYEVDRSERRIRRLEGINQPTPRQGADGEWKQYIAISHIEIGSPVLVFWRYASNGLGLEGTHTSRVREITHRM